MDPSNVWCNGPQRIDYAPGQTVGRDLPYSLSHFKSSLLFHPDTMEPLPDPGDDEGGQAGFGGSAGLGMAVSGRDMSNLYGNATMKGMRVSGSAMSGAVGGTPRLPARQIVRGSGGGGGPPF